MKTIHVLATICLLALLTYSNGLAQCPSGYTHYCDNAIVDGCDVTICYCVNYNIYTRLYDIQIKSITKNSPCSTPFSTLLVDAQIQILNDNQFGAGWFPCDYQHVWYNVTVTNAQCWKFATQHIGGPFDGHDISVLTPCDESTTCVTQYAVCRDAVDGTVHIIPGLNHTYGSSSCSIWPNEPQENTCYSMPCPQ